MNDEPKDHGQGAVPSPGPRTSEGLTDWTIPVVPSNPVHEKDWEWAHRPVPQPPIRIDAEHVAVVLLVHDADPWLPRTLVALARLRERPGVTIAVDLGSRDDSPTLLAKAHREGLVEDLVGMDADTAPGVALAKVVPTLPDDITHLWILHDDVEVTPDALAHLLAEASSPSRPDVLFPTLLKPARRNYPELIEEQGQTVSPTGSRILPVIDTGDIDQHQGEQVAVLGGSTAGMFCSLKAWRRLDGLDPALPLFRDGVDFGWRANEAGFVVRTAPTCALHHRQVGRGWERESNLAPRPDRADRLAGMRLVAARSAHPGRTSLWLLLVALGRAVVLLLGKAPGRAGDELRAGWALWASRSTTVEMARRIREFRAGCDPDDIDHARRLLPTRRSLWSRIADGLASGLSDRLQPARGDDVGTSIDELTGDEFAARDHHGVVNPYVVMVVAMTVVGLVAGRHLYGSGHVVSRWLPPAPGGISEAWHTWLTATPGQPGANSPWLALAALGSTLSLGRAEIFARLCLIVAPLVAAMSAHRLLRRVMGLGATTVLLSSLWGLLPVIGGGLARGSVTALLMAVVMPHIALHGWRLLAPETIDVDLLWGARVGRHDPDPWRSAGALAVWSTIAMSVMPVSWLLLVLVGGGILVADRGRWRQVLLVLVAPLVAVSPWLPRLIDAPARIITGTDPLLKVATSARGGLWVLLGIGVGDGAAPIWVAVLVMVPLWFATLWALVWLWRDRMARGTARTRSRTLVIAGVCLLSLGVAAIACRRYVTLWGTQVHPEIETWQLVACGALIILVAVAWQGTNLQALETEEDTPGTEEGEEPPTLGQLMARWSSRVLPTVVAVSVLAGSLWWVVAGAGQPLHRASSKLPAYVTAVEDSPRHTRTLMVLVQGGTTTWNLVSSRNPSWGSGEQPLVSADAPLAAAAGQLAQAVGSGAVPDDLADRLSKLGIGHLWLRGASDDLIGQVGNASGLTPAKADSTTVVWTVDGNPSRAMVVSGSTWTPVAGSVPAGSGSRTLVLVEAPDDRWQVTVGGRRLQSAGVAGAGSAYRLDSATGRLSWSMPTQTWAALVEVGMMIVLLIVAGPTAARRAPAPRRAARARGNDD
ncbi:glycosyltransferase family 2 protein [Acidipropionibacterium timonense]|uniref:glycosyltransferase family 2 protein n=1 Tax=Acidipropionibacterium timonense TaxID=2161818 RepID=UPI0010304B8F|nr:glycosyltransferase family 2 protein [Acidipropionibacterium timonense]